MDFFSSARNFSSKDNNFFFFDLIDYTKTLLLMTFITD